MLAQRKSKKQGASIQKSLIKNRVGKGKDSSVHLILQRGLLLRVGLESEALDREELGHSSWCQGWRDGNTASDTCFQFPVAKKIFWLIIKMPDAVY